MIFNESVLCLALMRKSQIDVMKLKIMLGLQERGIFGTQTNPIAIEMRYQKLTVEETIEPRNTGYFRSEITFISFFVCAFSYGTSPLNVLISIFCSVISHNCLPRD